PFSYTVPSTQMVAGTMQIQLTVTDNKQATATDAVTVTITTPAPDTNSMTDPRDSKTYRTVKMGTQIWMAENLAYQPQVNTIIEGSEVKENEEKPFYYVYGYDGNDVAAAKATKYYKDGVLYNWYAAIQGKGANAGNADLNPSGMQGICPEGWHLPSKDEWGQLYEWVGANIEDSIKKDFEGNEIKAKNVSGALRATTGWDPYSDSDMPDLAKGGLDLFGFCVKTYGGRDTKGFGFSGLGTMANYWATDYKSNSYGAQGGYVRFTRIDYDIAGGFIDANRGQSVRCVKN
ncbi:MAG: FISUMP domain-containing protein, partial [Alistipes sp.]